MNDAGERLCVQYKLMVQNDETRSRLGGERRGDRSATMTMIATTMRDHPFRSTRSDIPDNTTRKTTRTTATTAWSRRRLASTDGSVPLSRARGRTPSEFSISPSSRSSSISAACSMSLRDESTPHRTSARRQSLAFARLAQSLAASHAPSACGDFDHIAVARAIYRRTRPCYTRCSSARALEAS